MPRMIFKKNLPESDYFLAISDHLFCNFIVMKKLLLPICIVALAGPLQAATLVFNGTLQGSQEVPATPSAGTGSVSLTVDDITRAWSLTGNFSGLTGNSSNAHIHGPALAGFNAGVIAGLTFTPGVTAGTLSGSGTFTETQFADLVSLKYYVNLHSTSFGSGELRAQLIPETSSAAFTGLAGLLLLSHRRRR